jgi:peptidoglycan/LPS O-acetylase OafA/YrhL
VTPRTAGAGPDRFVQLDALRFFFALIVVLVHTIGFKLTLVHGGYAVDFFFILSGFVLTHALLRRPMSAGGFAWARLARLYPLHLATLLWLFVMVGGVQGGGGNGAEAFVLNLLLLQGLGVIGSDTWNFPSWSISVEFLVNILLLYPVVRFRSRVAASVIVIVAVAVILRVQGPVFDLFNVQPVYGPILSGGLLRGSAGILLGYLLYEAWLILTPRIDSSRWQVPATIVEIALCGLLLFCLGTDRPIWRALPAPLSALLILQMATVPGGLSRLFQTRLFAELGNISYAIYLLHIPLFAVFVGAGWLPQRESGFTWMWCLYLLLLLGLAEISFYFLERPAQRRLNSLLLRR